MDEETYGGQKREEGFRLCIGFISFFCIAGATVYLSKHSEFFHREEPKERITISEHWYGGRTIRAGASRNYFGTDKDKNGILDDVRAHWGGGRCGMATHVFKKGDIEYKQLQQKYSRALKSKNR